MEIEEDERQQDHVPGRVRVWHDVLGWGVLDSEFTPGGCWAHGAHVLVDGYRSLSAGEAVTFAFEEVDQDGFVFRALEVWPVGQAPVLREVEHGEFSTLVIHVDAEDDASRP